MDTLLNPTARRLTLDRLASFFFRRDRLACVKSFKYVGTEIEWVGEGVDEFGHVKGDPENIVVKVDPRYFRPTEVELLLVSDEEKSGRHNYCTIVSSYRMRTRCCLYDKRALH